MIYNLADVFLCEQMSIHGSSTNVLLCLVLLSFDWHCVDDYFDQVTKIASFLAFHNVILQICEEQLAGTCEWHSLFAVSPVLCGVVLLSAPYGQYF